MLFSRSDLALPAGLPVGDASSLMCLFPPPVPRSCGVQQASATDHPAQAESLSARGSAHQAAAALHGLLPAAAVQGLHAGAGHRQPGAGEAAPRLAGSHHRAAPEGTGEGVLAPHVVAGRGRGPQKAASCTVLQLSKPPRAFRSSSLPAAVLLRGWLCFSLKGQFVGTVQQRLHLDSIQEVTKGGATFPDVYGLSLHQGENNTLVRKS